MGDWQHYLIKGQQFLGNYLPLKNPVLILSVLLLIILFSPLLSKRFRIPGIIGLIISGILIGPHSFHIIESTTSFGRNRGSKRRTDAFKNRVALYHVSGRTRN